jgi:hypothetical protein
MLDTLPDNSLTYFHNLKYDHNFLAYFGGIKAKIDKAGRTMNFEITYKDKFLMFKDSLSMISQPLKEFPKMFRLGDTKKELFPYRYYRG